MASASGPRILLVTCLAFFAPLSAAFAQTNYTIGDFFNDGQIQNIYLTVDPGDWATLRQNYEANDYYQANFSWNGLGGTVGIRSRGNGSRSPVKPNLDVNIDKYVKKQTFLGINFFVLKANNQDPSTIGERIAFKLFTKMGLPAPREVPARVYINNDFFGYYNIVEHLDENFLQRNFGESGGYLYEWQPVAAYNFEYLGSDPSLYAPFLELKTDQDDPDLPWFVDFVTAINQSSDAGFVSAVSPYLNPRLYLTHVAIEEVLGEVDGIVGGVFGMNNFYLYRFAGSNLSQLIVWDKDLAFLALQKNIFDGTQTNVLTRRLLAIPEYRSVYLDALQKAATVFGGAGGWGDQELSSEYSQIQALASNDPNKQCISNGVPTSCSAQDFENSIASLRSFIAQRAPAILQQVTEAGYQPPASKPVVTGATIAAANGAAQLVPGSLANVNVSNLKLGSLSSGGALGRNAGDAFIALNGIRAPLAAISNGQVTIQVPWDVSLGVASLVAANAGQLGNTLDVQVAALAPAILAVAHADGTVISSAKPAVAGEVLSLFGTGFGMTGQYFDAGAAAPNGTLVPTTTTPAVTIGSAVCPLFFSGLAPGLVGVYQVNFSVPSGLFTGTISLNLSIGDQNATINLFVTE